MSHSCEIVIDGDTVLRKPRADGGIFPVYDLGLQTRVINALRDVPTPRPATFEDGAMRMPFVAGAIPNDFTPLDPWLAGLPNDDARRRVWESTIDVIAAIHREPLVDGLRVGLGAELDYWSDYVDWMGDPPANLRDAFAWCRAHEPADPSPNVLLWGDVRFGNIVYDEATFTPKCVLDWDMVSAGPRELDIAWLTALDAVGNDLTGLSVPGFGSRTEALERFGCHTESFDWYEIFAMVRASAISTRIALLSSKPMFKPGEDPTLAAALTRISKL